MQTKDCILSDGFLVLENFFDPCKFDILNIIAQNKEKFTRATGHLMTRYTHLLGSDPVFQNLLLSTNILQYAHEILGEIVNLSDMQVVTLHPGAPTINPHVDYPFNLMDKFFIDPIALLQSIWILDDFTELNGATRVVAGSHKIGLWPNNDIFERDSKKLIFKKGTVILMHGALWHDTSPNLSEKNRSSLLISFCPPWIKPLSNLAKNVERSELHEKIQELLGMKNVKYLVDTLLQKQDQVYTQER